MKNIKELIELRTKIKTKKPEFSRQDYGKRKKLELKWNKPKGIHSKIRHKFKGRKRMPSPGFGSPKLVKGLHDSGLKVLRLSSLSDLKNVKSDCEGIIIPKTFGIKKKIEILKKAKELNIHILNPNIDMNTDEYLKKLEGK